LGNCPEGERGEELLVWRSLGRSPQAHRGLCKDDEKEITFIAKEFSEARGGGGGLIQKFIIITIARKREGYGKLKG